MVTCGTPTIATIQRRSVSLLQSYLLSLLLLACFSLQASSSVHHYRTYRRPTMASLVTKRTAHVRGATTGFVGTEASYPAGVERDNQLQRKATIPKTLPPRDPVYLWSSLIAGVGSGALSSVICAPLDLIRTRLQVRGDLNMPSSTLRQAFTEIMEKEGWRGYFRGLGASLMTVPAFWGVYFPLYDDMKRRWVVSQPDTPQSLVHCGSAVFAGGVSDFICNPLFVVRTRLQTEALHNMADGSTQRGSSGLLGTAKSLYREGGVLIFWRGMTANLMGLSHVAVQFPVYEYLKTTLVKQRQLRNKSDETEPNAIELFIASGLSKMTASLLTYPHEVIRSRMMDARGAAGTTLMRTAGRVYAQDGVLGFYSGLPVAMIRVIPNCCITFMTYEFMLRIAKEEIKKYREGK